MLKKEKTNYKRIVRDNDEEYLSEFKEIELMLIE